MEDGLPELPYLPPASLTPEVPVQRVFTADDIPTLLGSDAVERISVFIGRCSEAVVGRAAIAREEATGPVQAFASVLDELDRWISEIPLDTNPQRFGNRAFRVWGRRLEAEARRLHEAVIPKAAENVLPEILHHFVRSFGNFTRLDYGTGHELSFLSYLALLRMTHLLPPPPPGSPPLELEAQTVLVVYYRYLQICARLQTVYRLEPAGSRGVHGLDDFFHVGWGFAAAQVRNHPSLRPSYILTPPASLPSPPSSPSSSLLVFLLSHLHSLKRGGPLSETSPLLYTIGSTVPTWTKVQKGVEKMWRAEVLSKEVVMQHWWLTDHGGLSWTKGGEKLPMSKRAAAAAVEDSTPAPVGAGTKAPWATHSGPTSRLGRTSASSGSQGGA